MELTFTIEKQGAGYLLALNSKALESKEGNLLELKTEKAAELLKNEIKEQKLSGPLYALMSAYTDAFVIKDRSAYIKQLLDYLDNDLLCYVAPEPKDLVRKQTQLWQPVRQYIEQKYMLKLVLTQGLGHVVQPTDVYNSVKEIFTKATDKEFAVMYFTAKATKSVLLGIYFTLHEDEGAEKLHQRASLEEIYYQERYKEDAEQLKTLQDRLNEIKALEDFKNFF